MTDRMMMLDDIEGARPRKKNYNRTLFTDKEKVKNMMVENTMKNKYNGDHRSTPQIRDSLDEFKTSRTNNKKPDPLMQDPMFYKNAMAFYDNSGKDRNAGLEYSVSKFYGTADRKASNNDMFNDPAIEKSLKKFYATEPEQNYQHSMKPSKREKRVEIPNDPALIKAMEQFYGVSNQNQNQHQDVKTDIFGNSKPVQRKFPYGRNLTTMYKSDILSSPAFMSVIRSELQKSQVGGNNANKKSHDLYKHYKENGYMNVFLYFI